MSDDVPPSLGRPEDELLTTAQVAQMLHVAPPTVIKYVKDGTLRAHRLPGTRPFLFWRHEIVALIEASVVQAHDMDAGDAEKSTTGGE